MLDSRKDNVIVQTKELGHDLSDDVSEQGLTSMQNEGSKDAVVLHSGPEVTSEHYFIIVYDFISNNYKIL